MAHNTYPLSRCFFVWCMSFALQVKLGESFVVTTPQTSPPTALASLHTAWEWLADARQVGEPGYRPLEWVDPTSFQSSSSKEENEHETSWHHVPLYPIPAVYLPVAGVNHTLNNIEPRNIQMALDLMMKGEDGLFCLAVRAADTGRIARVGTLMRLIHAQPHSANPQEDGTSSSISRIVVTCVGLEPVTIDSINNGPEAENKISKLMRSPVYLKASVTSRRFSASRNDDKPLEEGVVHALLKDYSLVRRMYVHGVGQQEIPIFAREHLAADLPEEWTSENMATDASFWQAAYTWQSLCNTVREGRQIGLSADRNERMIEAASRRGGPLQLPIHMEDLPPPVRRQLQQMEVDRQKEFAFVCKMDPVLDFLVLLQMPSLADRVRQLSHMVARERQRLTTAAALREDAALGRNDNVAVEPPRRGAWFDGDFR